jgi:glycosyltransferase involved in cell wall biosynthesis
MRAAVYDAHLDTLGGGERYAAMLAAVLAGTNGVSSVDLLGHGQVSLDVFARHLGLDLTGVTLRLVPDQGEASISALSAEYDLFVNASYMSRVVSRARHSSYAVYFPTPWDHDLTPRQRRLGKLLGRHVNSAPAAARAAYGLGWFTPERGRRRTWSWTSGTAQFCLEPGPATRVLARVGRPGAPGPTELVVELDGQRLAQVTAGPAGFAPLAVIVPASDRDRVLELRSETFSPPPPDQRQLGVAVSLVQVGPGRRLSSRERLAGRLPYLLRDVDNLEFLDSYQQVLSISRYTAGWVERLWHRDSTVLYPPVHTSAVAPGPKRPVVLSIGRFFAEDRGHSKKQLEMVRAFVAAQRSGKLHGWELHLVGGCSAEDEAYLEGVRAAGVGHAVHVHANAPRHTVERLLSEASVFWHATGLDADPDERPWAFEHFGITTVEAMAAGCVPVVIAQAGQTEIVRDGVDGYLFSTLDEAVARTVELANDPRLREELATAAVERAATFSEHAFADRWQALVGSLLAAG